MVEPHCVDLFLDCKFRSPFFTKFGDQFLTSPPITQIRLSRIPFEDGSESAVLRMSDGITFRDLEKTVRRLGVLDDNVRCSRRTCLRHWLGLSFCCSKGARMGPVQGWWRMELGLMRAFLVLKVRGWTRWGW